jgi:hypothetical protein
LIFRCEKIFCDDRASLHPLIGREIIRQNVFLKTARGVVLHRNRWSTWTHEMDPLVKDDSALVT